MSAEYDRYLIEHKNKTMCEKAMNGCVIIYLIW